METTKKMKTKGMFWCYRDAKVPNVNPVACASRVCMAIGQARLSEIRNQPTGKAGCRHNECFTCPFEDCIYPGGDTYTVVSPVLSRIVSTQIDDSRN